MRKRSSLLVALLFLACGMAVPLCAAEYPNITLESLLTPQQQASLNIAGMSAERREVLRQALIGSFVAGFQRGKAEGQKSMAAVAAAAPSTASPAPSGGVVETEIDGDFEGWNGETIVKLMNGEVWQQTEYHYEYHYAYNPQVLIYQSGGSWKMKVDGTDEAVGVTRLR